jgi:hypothetical protein
MTNFKAAAMAAGFVALLSFQTHQQKKTYKVEAPIEFWIQITNGIEFTKNNLKTSDLPSKTVTIINDSLFAPFQSEIARQINEQIALEKKKDSTKPKKN